MPRFCCRCWSINLIDRERLRVEKETTFKMSSVSTSTVREEPNLFSAQDSREDIPQTRFHLTARPWAPLQVSKDTYLDVIEGLCRYTAQLQNQSGAVIDPFLKREHQYSTPYFAYAVGTLIQAGRADDLLEPGAQGDGPCHRMFRQGRQGHSRCTRRVLRYVRFQPRWRFIATMSPRKE